MIKGFKTKPKVISEYTVSLTRTRFEFVCQRLYWVTRKLNRVRRENKELKRRIRYLEFALFESYCCSYPSESKLYPWRRVVNNLIINARQEIYSRNHPKHKTQPAGTESPPNTATDTRS